MYDVQSPERRSSTSGKNTEAPYKRTPPLGALSSVPGVRRPEDIYTWLLRTLLTPLEATSTSGISGTSSTPAQSPGALPPRSPQTAASPSTSTSAAEIVYSTHQQDFLEYALLMLGRKWERMDAAAALDCIPGDTPLQRLGPCIQAMSVGIMRHSHGSTLHVRISSTVCCLIEAVLHTRVLQSCVCVLQ